MALPQGDTPTGDTTSGECDREPLVIDCDCCVARGLACGDCVVSVLLGGPPDGLELDSDEVGALDALAGSGLVPPLRLVTAIDGPDPHSCGPG